LIASLLAKSQLCVEISENKTRAGELSAAPKFIVNELDRARGFREKEAIDV
jgi:hypothetical protein